MVIDIDTDQMSETCVSELSRNKETQAAWPGTLKLISLVLPRLPNPP